MYQQILNEKIGKIRDLDALPAMPALGQQILSQITSEHVDIPRLARTIEQDPGVFARIIGIANSAYFGCPDQIYTVSQAIVRVLGLCMVKSLALSIVMNEPFQTDACRAFDMKRYWRKAMLTALISQRLSNYIKLGRKDFSDLVYLAGTLHNIGDLILAHLFPNEIDDVLNQLQQTSAVKPFRLQEDIVGINSMQAADILATRWKLPPEVQVLYRHYDNVNYDGEGWQLLCLVRLGNMLMHIEDMDEITNRLDIQTNMRRLGLTSGQLKKQLQKIDNDRVEVEALAEILSLN